MVGVDESTKGGMWTVVENYLKNKEFVTKNDLIYIPTSITGCSAIKKIVFTLKAYWQIIKVFKNNKIDIIHVHMSERASIYRKRIIMEYAKIKRTKIILHMHGAEFEILYKQMNKFKQDFVRKTLNFADKIIILGEYWKEFIGELVDEPSKICVVYNAVEVPEKYEYSIENNIILFLGSVSKRKGIYIFLEALKNVSNLLQNSFEVKIYGPSVEEDITDKVKRLGLEKWVEYGGWLNEIDKKEVLKRSAINVLPSFNEGLPMTILEAMSYGVPTITTTVAAIPEVVNNNNGALVSPGDIEALADQIIKIALDYDYRLQLSKQAYVDAFSKFSVDRHISSIQGIYEELVK